MLNTNQVNVDKMYKTRMSTGEQGSAEGNQIIEQRHTRSEIISRAEGILSKELGQDLATYAGLEEVGMRGNNVGEDTIYGYVDEAGKKVDFTEEMKFKAAIDVLNLHGHFFEATPIN